MQLKITTPKGIFLDKKVTSVTVKAAEGYMTVLDGHTPFISSIQASEMYYIGEDGKKESYRLSSGLLYVEPKKTKIITDSIESTKNIMKRRESDVVERIQKSAKIK